MTRDRTEDRPSPPARDGALGDGAPGDGARRDDARRDIDGPTGDDRDRQAGGGGEARDRDALPPSFDGRVYDEVVRQSLDAIIVTDPAYVVRTWSPAAERLYGIPAGEAVGRALGALLVGHDLDGRPLDRAAARSALEREGVWRRQLIQRPTTGPLAGEDVIVDAVVTLLRGPDGALTGILAVNRDVTATARLESEMATLGSLVAATGGARTPAEIAAAALDILCRATGAEAGLVTSIEGVNQAEASRGVSQATVDVVVDYGRLGGPLAEALAEPDAYVRADVASTPMREEVRAAVAADGVRHLIVVGLRVASRLTGVLALGWRGDAPREPSPAIMLQAAALVASSIENARLLEAVENGLNAERLLTRRMAALVELTRLPTVAALEGLAMERLLADVCEIVGADGATFGRVIDDHVVPVAFDRLDPAWVRPLLDRPLSSVPLADRLMGGTPAVLLPVADGSISPEGVRETTAHGYRTLAAFAIRDEGALVGVMFALFARSIDEVEVDERTLDAIGRVLDITFANRRLREVVSASERRYRELFERSPEALLVQSPDGVIVDANPAAVRLYGEGLIGHPISDLYVDDPAAPVAALDAADDGEPVLQFTGTGRRLDGSTFPEEVDIRPIEIAGERRTLAIVRDLTERSRMQAELVQAQKMEAIGLLVAGVAHELNNPLASIIAFSQLIRTDPALPPDLRGQADLLVQEANRTRVIVQNLLDFARQRPPERVETELRPLVDSVLGLQSYIFGRSHLKVEVDIPEDLPRLSIDRSQIQQVLINLTVNAAQAIRDAGRPGLIRISARELAGEAGSVVRIEVADDGPGIPAEITDRLFMPFVTTKQPGEGTGLGLSVSFGIVAGHGGTLRHAPRPGGGATFTIELPAGRAGRDGAATAGTGGRVEGPATNRPATGAAGVGTDGGAEQAGDRAAGGGRELPGAPARPVRVLVLDDEPSIREFLGRVLVRSGYEPVIAATGRAALDLVRADPPDVVLCDHRMAGMSGIEFHAAVRTIDPRLGRRFAFMSGDVLNPELRDFAAAHDVRILPKPFDIAAVAGMVATLLEAEPA